MGPMVATGVKVACLPLGVRGDLEERPEPCPNTSESSGRGSVAGRFLRHFNRQTFRSALAMQHTVPV